MHYSLKRIRLDFELSSEDRLSVEYAMKHTTLRIRHGVD